ncbi:hypothetical protein B1690_15245 [Geobacillus sp. 46C-IIa]|uniref:hypothetical protein n=2 Tax=Geobacillus sp. 46C-IIa TaxID=1963025 RepID=UPI0009BF6E9A|nr:hypothetical protein [Geobacillus sp. 46C-IIa]OQP04628.1 hypothetical protein B1690_15245 [Geobacillus sp. 46C-IIa]
MKDVLFIAYFFSESDGVGALRSRSMVRFLKEKGVSVEVMARDSFRGIGKKNFYVWTILCIFKLLFSKQKNVYISCGPFNHLLPLSLACFIRKKKLIVDFRDPWSINIKTGYGKSGAKISKFKLFVSSWIEQLVYKICRHFIVCTKGMKSYYQKLFGNDTKIRLIMNGYDFDIGEVDKYKDSHIKNNGVLKFVCLGKFAEYDEQKAHEAISKIKDIKNEGYSVHIYFVGTNKEPTLSILKQYKLDDCSTFYPRMPYKEALKIAINCNIGMLIVRNEEIEYGTKVFDYIGLGLPVLDIFDHSNNFYKEFKNILNLSQSFSEIPKDIRSLYSRDRNFAAILHLLH